MSFVDPTGLETLQFGWSLQGGCGAGAQVTTGWVISYSVEKGFQIGLYNAVGTGAFAGCEVEIDRDINKNSKLGSNHLVESSSIKGHGIEQIIITE